PWPSSCVGGDAGRSLRRSNRARLLRLPRRVRFLSVPFLDNADLERKRGAYRDEAFSALGRRNSTDSKMHLGSPMLTHFDSWNSIFMPSDRFVQPATKPATKGQAGLSRRPSCRAARPIAVPSGKIQWTWPVASSYSISQRPHPAPDKMPLPEERSRVFPSFAGASVRSRALTSAPFQPEVYPTR